MRFRLSKEILLRRMFCIRTEIKAYKVLKCIPFIGGSYQYCVFYRKWWQRKNRYFAESLGKGEYWTLAEAQKVAFNIRYYMRERKLKEEAERKEKGLLPLWMNLTTMVIGLISCVLCARDTIRNFSSSSSKHLVIDMPQQRKDSQPETPDSEPSIKIFPY